VTAQFAAVVTGNPAFSTNYKQLADAISGSIFTIGANGL